MMPKPFVLEDVKDRVYVPRGVIRAGRCPCVHVCPVFANYKYTDDGYRIIPSGAKCPYIVNQYGNLPDCNGQHLFMDGKFYFDGGLVHVYKRVWQKSK